VEAWGPKYPELDINGITKFTICFFSEFPLMLSKFSNEHGDFLLFLLLKGCVCMCVFTLMLLRPFIIRVYILMRSIGIYIHVYIPLLPDQTCYWKKIIFFPSVRLMFHPYTTLKLLEIPWMVVIFLVQFLCV
jgi:hypothetical protein